MWHEMSQKPIQKVANNYPANRHIATSQEHRNIHRFIYANGMPFLHTKSSNINFLEGENFISGSADKIIQELHTVTNMYKVRGFNINICHGDNKFNINALRDHIRSASLNIFAQGRHITIIKRYIKTTNKWYHCTTHYVPYKRYTRLTTRSLLECIVHSRNSFPKKFIISKRLGANTILLVNNMKRIFFGSYDMVYTGTKNNVKHRNIPSISLRESN